MHCMTCFTHVRLFVRQLAMSRMVVPGRATTCSHPRCFDLASYLQMNEKKPTWICPVCHSPAEYKHLFIDGFVFASKHP